MFYFTLNGAECRCDTIEELQTVFPDTKLVWTARRDEDELALTKDREFPLLAAVVALPLVRGPISWKKVKFYAKKLGRTNLTQLRTDLCVRRGLEPR